MKLINYKIPSQLFIKAEVTKLATYDIANNSDKYYVVIPTVVSDLPSSVMFIQNISIIEPHSVLHYAPQLVKLGASLSNSMSTPLPNGIEIQLLVIDNIDALGAITSIISSKTRKKNVQQVMDANPTSEITDMIDRRLMNLDAQNSASKDNSASPQVTEVQMSDIVQPEQLPQLAPPRHKRTKRKVAENTTETKGVV